MYKRLHNKSVPLLH